jgi:hypothetical protein
MQILFEVLLSGSIQPRLLYTIETGKQNTVIGLPLLHTPLITMFGLLRPHSIIRSLAPGTSAAQFTNGLAIATSVPR